MDLPDDHAAVLDRIRAAVSADARFVGLAVGGSLPAGAVDRYSDLDFVVVVDDAHHAAVMAGRREIAESWGDLLAAFTGEHVGEPRLLICLYDHPLLHVDLKFVTAGELAHRADDPVVLWERGSAVSAALARTPAVGPAPDPQWVEDRFWVWVHYAATKLGRGELFEVLDFLGFLRGAVLAPMHPGQRYGVRRLEQRAPEFVAELERTVAGYDRAECASAVLSCVAIYRDRRPAAVVRRDAAERASIRYLAEVIDGG